MTDDIRVTSIGKNSRNRISYITMNYRLYWLSFLLEERVCEARLSSPHLFVSRLNLNSIWNQLGRLVLPDSSNIHTTDASLWERERERERGGGGVREIIEKSYMHTSSILLKCCGFALNHIPTVLIQPQNLSAGITTALAGLLERIAHKCCF